MDPHESVADRCDVTVTVTLRAEWTAALAGNYSSKDEMIEELRQALLADVDEVTALPGVHVLDIVIAAGP